MTNRLQESVDLLYYLQNKFQSLYLEDDYFFKCINYNMATAQFHLGNINTSRKYLNELINHPKRVMSYDGLEGFFYCHATECLLAIEEGDQEYALYRIQAIERKYKDMLKQTHHERNNAFIKIIKKVVTNEQLWGKEDFRKEVNSFIAMKTLYNAGPEFISFNAWLYSKLENVPYNEAEYNKVMEKKLNA